jgi:hypothetical protein
MAELKTKPTSADVTDFINAIPEEQRRRDCHVLIDIMREATGCEPKMWGTAIVGFGDYQYASASGRTGDWFLLGFSPRKAALSLYIMAGFHRFDAIMQRLGKYKTGKGCLYIKKLADIDLDALKELAGESVRFFKSQTSMSIAVRNQAPR